MPDTEKAPITTHMLDQTIGRPASGIKVILSCDTNTEEDYSEFTAETDQDGRVSKWVDHDSKGDVNVRIWNTIQSSSLPRQWRLIFFTESYFARTGKKSFYPRVELIFTVDPKDDKQHWHVPVLLGPFGYTTYRGS